MFKFAIDKRAEAPDGYEYTQTTDYPAGASARLSMLASGETLGPIDSTQLDSERSIPCGNEPEPGNAQKA